MKKILFFIAIATIIMFNAGLSFSAQTESLVGVNSCGYEMMIVSVPDTLSVTSTYDVPAIIDAWTTNDPYGNPYNEVYDFTMGVDVLAFVVEYYHTGGTLPEQWARGWVCGKEDRIMKTCRFKWTISYLPPGTYLLINYQYPITFAPGSYDWAAKVGDVVFGWPNMSSIRPDCFTIY